MTKHNIVTDEALGKLHRRIREVERRIYEGTLNLEPTMAALQEIIEGKNKLIQKSIESEQVRCDIFSGNRCTICGSFFDEGDICMNGHWLGQSYPR